MKRSLGPWLSAGAASFATGWTQLDGGQLGHQANINAYGGGLRARAAYDFAFASWYLRPRLDLDLLYVNMPGFQLTAQGMTVMAVGGFAKTSFVATPNLEVGGRYDVESTRMILRPYAAVGASFLPDNTSTYNVTFTGPLAPLGSFQTFSNGPTVLANVEAGMQLYRSSGIEVRAAYPLTTGYSYLSQSASLRGAWHF